MTAPILILGARGKTGQRLARHLMSAGHGVRLASRNPTGDLEVAFDWADYPKAVAAFDGIRTAYIVAPTDRNDHAEVMIPVLERALQSGVRRLVLLSAASVERGGPMMGAVHDWMADHAPEWAVLRPSWFMQNFAEPRHINTARENGAIYSATADGKVAFIDADDIARGAMAALTAPEAWNRDLVLTGPQSLTYADVADHLSQLLRIPVRHVNQSEDEMAQRLEGLGMPANYAEVLAAMDTEIANGSAETLTNEVERTTNVAPRSLAQCMASDPVFSALKA